MGRGERGISGSIQMMLLLPVAFGIFLLVLQWAMLAWAEATALAAAEDGARAGAAYGAAAGAAEEAALRACAGEALSGPEITVVKTAKAVTVEVSGQANGVLPGFLNQVTKTAHMPLERINRG